MKKLLIATVLLSTCLSTAAAMEEKPDFDKMTNKLSRMSLASLEPDDIFKYAMAALRGLNNAQTTVQDKFFTRIILDAALLEGVFKAESGDAQLQKILGLCGSQNAITKRDLLSHLSTKNRAWKGRIVFNVIKTTDAYLKQYIATNPAEKTDLRCLKLAAFYGRQTSATIKGRVESDITLLMQTIAGSEEQQKVAATQIKVAPKAISTKRKHLIVPEEEDTKKMDEDVSFDTDVQSQVLAAQQYYQKLKVDTQQYANQMLLIQEEVNAKGAVTTEQRQAFGLASGNMVLLSDVTHLFDYINKKEKSVSAAAFPKLLQSNNPITAILGKYFGMNLFEDRLSMTCYFIGMYKPDEQTMPMMQPWFGTMAHLSKTFYALVKDLKNIPDEVGLAYELSDRRINAINGDQSDENKLAIMGCENGLAFHAFMNNRKPSMDFAVNVLKNSNNRCIRTLYNQLALFGPDDSDGKLAKIMGYMQSVQQDETTDLLVLKASLRKAGVAFELT